MRGEDRDLRRAKHIAYRLLGHRMRSCKEVQEKLEARNFSSGIISEVIHGLKRLGYVNDETFALEWAKSRALHSGFGKWRIGQELRQKGISTEYINKVNKEILTTAAELGNASRAAEKKLHSMRALEREVRRRRLAAFLERKGYASDIIREVLEKYLDRKHGFSVSA